MKWKVVHPVGLYCKQYNPVGYPMDEGVDKESSGFPSVVTDNCLDALLLNEIHQIEWGW